MIDTFRLDWSFISSAVVVVVAVVAAMHAIMYKRNPRSALLWVAVTIVLPVIGPILYMVFGINRMKRKAAGLYHSADDMHKWLKNQDICTPGELATLLPEKSRHLAVQSLAVANITGLPLLKGNTVTPLLGGDEAYPAMLDAIASAHYSITLCTYIFANDAIGRSFVDALSEAVQRGVEVRVLVDYVGSRYSFPPIGYRLQRRGIPYAWFLPTINPWHTTYTNMRNHRKIMVVDGCKGFTGGTNIRAGRHVQDLHFCLQGPVVSEMQQAFMEDWAFAANETLAGPPWFTSARHQGQILARGISDGPDGDYDKLRQTLLSAIAMARYDIRIVTPYFLPDADLIAALNTASLRGVSVEVLIPQKNNLHLVGWAMRAHLWQILERGCKVYCTAPPFDHSKLLVIDNQWSLIGSSNWDPRSLRLNFEFCVEAYDEKLAGKLNAIVDEKRRQSRQISLEEMDARSLPVRLRDGFARLFFPYL